MSAERDTHRVGTRRNPGAAIRSLVPFARGTVPLDGSVDSEVPDVAVEAGFVADVRFLFPFDFVGSGNRANDTSGRVQDLDFRSSLLRGGLIEGYDDAIRRIVGCVVGVRALVVLVQRPLVRGARRKEP